MGKMEASIAACFVLYWTELEVLHNQENVPANHRIIGWKMNRKVAGKFLMDVF